MFTMSLLFTMFSLRPVPLSVNALVKNKRKSVYFLRSWGSAGESRAGRGALMSILQEKPGERLNASWLSHPIMSGTAAPSDDRDGWRNPAALWLADGFMNGDTEPLPSMFRPKAKANGTQPQLARTKSADKTRPGARLSKLQISSRTPSYIIAAFLLVFAAVDGVLLAAPTFSDNRHILLSSTSAALDQGETEVATLFSAPFPEAAGTSQDQSLAPAQELLPEGEQWAAAVGTLEQLLAQRKAPQAAAMNTADNVQLLGRLEAWANARTRNPAATAQACTASAPQCRKGAALIQ
jgi:hypothetical protein